MRTLKENKWLLSLFAFALCFATCFMLTNNIIRVKAVSTKGNLDYSLATVSEAAAQYVNYMSSAGKEGVDEVPTNICAGDAGGLVGFVDLDATNRSFWLCSSISGNVCAWSYDSLGRVRTSSSDSSYIAAAGLKGYALYGYTLSELGLDSVGLASDNEAGRMLLGIGMMALYVLSVGMSTFFNLMLSILQFANPFRMFAQASASAQSAWAGSGGGGISAYSSASDTYGLTGVMNTIAAKVSSVYSVAHNISMGVMLPIFLAVAVFTWLVINKGGNFLKIFKPFFVRVIFVAIGVPLMFGLYGVILDDIQGYVTASGSPATTVVGSLFCDFDKWLESDNNLNPPSGYTFSINMNTMEVSSENMSQVRSICYAINKANWGSTVFNSTISLSTDPLTSYTDYDTTIASDTNKPTYRLGTTAATSVSEDAKSIGTVLSILQRYASGDKISAASYESGTIKSVLSKDASKAVVLFGTSSTMEDYDSKTAASFEYKANDGGGAAGASNNNSSITDIDLTDADVASIASSRWSGCPDYGDCDIFANGNLRASGLSNLAVRFGSETGSFSSCSGQALSSLALYNYLNTKFTSTQVLVSSPTSSSNDQVVYQHYAVSLVGNGFMKFIYVADAVILLACISLIGYGYGFAMMVANFKALVKMIPNVITGMFGSIRGIAASFALMFAMICEVVGTILMFDIAIEIIFACYKIVELPLAKALSSGALQNFNDSIGGNVSTGLLGIVSCVVIATITKKLLDWRTAIVGAASQACTRFVNKLLDSDAAAPNIDDGGSSIAAKAGTVAMAGASLAMGASRGYFGEDAQNKINEVKNKLTDGTASNAIKKSSLLSTNFGAKSGNGSGETVGMSDTENQSTNGITDTDSQIAQDEQNKSLTDSERAGMGVTDDETASAAYASAHEQEFESALNGDSDDDTWQSKLAGDSAADIQREDGDGYYVDEDGLHLYGDATNEYTDADGNAVKVQSSRSDDGTLTQTKTTTDASNGKVSTSKLVDSDASKYTSLDEYNADGSESHSTETLDKKTGNKVITQDVRTSSGRTLVEQNVSTNSDGNIETTTKKISSDGSVTNSTSVIDSATGDETINETVQAKGGTTYKNVTVHTDSSTGNVVTTTTTSGSGSGLKGGHTVVSETRSSDGEVVNTSSTTYSSSNRIINQDVTNVETVNDTVKTTQTVKQNGTVKTTVTEVNDTSGVKVVQETFSSGGNTTNQTTTYVKSSDGNYSVKPASVRPTTSQTGVSRNITMNSNQTVKGTTTTVTQNVNVNTENTTNVHTNMFDGGSTDYVSRVSSSGGHSISSGSSSQGSSMPRGRSIGSMINK